MTAPWLSSGTPQSPCSSPPPSGSDSSGSHRSPTGNAQVRKRPSPRGAQLAAALFLSLFFVLGAACTGEPEGPPPDAWVEIGNERVAVELAESPSEQAKGLGYRDRLDWDHGMFFVYDRPAQYRFWMKGMRFSIDIVWIRQGRIVDLSHSVPFELGSNGPTVQPSEAVDAVLEVPAGYAAASGWSVGDRVAVERTLSVSASD